MKGNIKFLIIVFAMILVAVYVVEPMLDEAPSTTQIITGVDYDVGEMMPVVERVREQEQIDIDDTWLVYQDYSVGNWNIHGYNTEDATHVVMSTDITHELRPKANGNQTMWAYQDETYNYIAGMDMDNLTKWEYIVGGIGIPNAWDIWDGVVYYSIYDEGLKLLSYDPYTDTETELGGIGALEEIYSIDVWETSMRIAGHDSLGDGVFYYSITTESLTKIDVCSTEGGIHEGKISWATPHDEFAVKYYDILTGRTEVVYDGTTLTGAVNTDIYGDWVVWSQSGAPTGFGLYAYNIDTDENVTLVEYQAEYSYGYGGVEIINNTVYFTVETPEIEYSDIYKIEIGVPDDASNGGTTTDDDGIADVLARNWYYIVGIFAVGIIVALEYGYYESEHLKAINRVLPVGLLLSVIIIAVIVIYLVFV